MDRRSEKEVRYDLDADCETRRLEAFLDGGLGDEERADLLEHLDSCAACCERLQSLAASVAEWRELPELLRLSTQCRSPSSEEVGSCDDDVDGEPSLDFLSPSDDPAMLGRVGHYEIMGAIRQGGMGIVLKGFDRPLNRTVAIKVLAPQLAVNGVARRRFAREAQAAAAVVHQHVIAIHGVAEHNNLPYLVMPYLSGQSLQRRIDQNGALAVTEILRIGMQTASGLAAAHAQGLVHRDVKPANILLEEGVERVVITDFGLARAADDASLTRSGVIAGTPHYMAPEQARGESIDHRADLFSLGASMYAMCTGIPPFRAKTALGVLRRVTEDEPRSIGDINPSIPDWLSEIIEKLLAKRPEDRFQSAEEVADLLARHLAHLQHPATHPMPPRLDEQARAQRSLARWRMVQFAMACAGVALLTIVVAGGIALLAPTEPKQASSVAPRVSEQAGTAPQVQPEKTTSAPGRREFASAEEQREYWMYWMEQCGRHAADWVIVPRDAPADNADRETVSDTSTNPESEAAAASPLRLLPQPVFGHVQRPSQYRRSDQIGGVYLWVDGSDRPAVAGCVLANAASEQRRLSHVFASLSTSAFRASWRGKELWTPEPGIEWKPLPNAPGPAASPDEWMEQFGTVASRFGGYSVDTKQRRWNLNVVPDPIYQWKTTASEEASCGAVFGICEDHDVESILLVESHCSGEQYEWKYALAAFTNYGLSITRDGEEVWKVGPRPSPVPMTSPRWVVSGIEYLPEPAFDDSNGLF